MSITDTTKVVVDSLKASPLVLALLVLVFVFMYFIYSSVQANRKDINDLMKVMVERCIK